MAMSRLNFRPWALFLFLGTSLSSVEAATHAWPVSSPDGLCQDLSLQACINAAGDGDTVQISKNTFLTTTTSYYLIDENININNKSLALTVADGVDAVLAANRNISVQTSGAGGYSVFIEKMILRRGQVIVIDSSSSANNFEVSRLRFQDTPQSGGLNTCAINFVGSNTPGGSSGFSAIENTILVASATSQSGTAICSERSYFTDIIGNRIDARNGGLDTGIRVLANAATSSVRVEGNLISGNSNTLATSGNLGTGIVISQSGISSGSLPLDLAVINNSATSYTVGTGLAVSLQLSTMNIINNTFVNGITGISLTTNLPTSGKSAEGVAAVNGKLYNNLVSQHATAGYFLNALAGPSTVSIEDRNNLSFANTSNTWGSGLHSSTIFSDPLIYSREHPRLRLTSPAINAGASLTAGSIPNFDALRERRIAGGTIDIGAYEFNQDIAGKVTRTSTNALNTVTNSVAIDLPLLSIDTPVVASIRTPDMSNVQLWQNPGVFYVAGAINQWGAFYESPIDTVAMTPGRSFSVLSPIDGKVGFTHTVGFEAQVSIIDNTVLNASTLPIAIATHKYIAGANLDVPIGMEYQNSASKWAVSSQTMAQLPLDSPFHIIVAPGSNPSVAPRISNAFRTNVGSLPTTEVVLEHPLLNDNPCAAPMVGRVDDPNIAGILLNPIPFSLEYRPTVGASGLGRWFIVAEVPNTLGGEALFPSNAAFNVIIDGNQSSQCLALSGLATDALFTDSFE